MQIIEFDEGFDTEVFFMWVFMIAIALLVLFLGYSMLGGEFIYQIYTGRGICSDS